MESMRAFGQVPVQHAAEMDNAGHTARQKKGRKKEGGADLKSHLLA
jgi:hypothetical protein